MLSLARSALLLVLSLALTACSGGGSSHAIDVLEPEPDPRSVRTPETSQQPVAVVNNRTIPASAVFPSLGEAAGGEVLEEVILDHLLSERMTREGYTLTEGDIDREAELLRTSLARASGADPRQARDLVDDLRRQRRLGPVRYRSLLRRNAMLRALVQQNVNIDESEVELIYQVVHGQRVQARVIVVTDEREAAALRRQLAATPDPALFAELALQRSTDPSGALGGQLEEISVLDPSYPASIRAALRSLNEGEISDVVALDNGYAVLLLEERIPPDGVRYESVREELYQDVRLARERAEMDRYARALLNSAKITVFDDSISWSWQTRRGG